MSSPTPITSQAPLVLSTKEAAFFKARTGIEDDAALRAHIIDVQRKALEVYPYGCIKLFAFVTLKISELPAYHECLRLGRERPEAILLDVGCCFGNDARKAVADGFPGHNVIASDLHQGFLDLGHELFRSTPSSCPITFLAGDVFSDAFLDLKAVQFGKGNNGRTPALRSLKTLTPLLGHVSVIHASSLFHLFNEEQQRQLAIALGALLSPEPESLIFGWHVGMKEKGIRQVASPMFCHSPESWRSLWDGTVFSQGAVKVDVGLQSSQVRHSEDGPAVEYNFLVWSVTKL